MDTFEADISRWMDKVADIVDLIFAASVQDVVNAAQDAVPVDTGFLKNSLQSSLQGGTALTGAHVSAATFAGMKTGGVITFGWTAEYAAHVEFGAQGRQPAFFARGAVQQWQAIVEANARRFASI